MHEHAGDPDAPPRSLLVVGAHGGAGASTLATLLSPAQDLGTVHHLPNGAGRALPADGSIVIATRNTVSAAWHATRAVTTIDSAREKADGHIAALVIVDDGAGAEPKEATARFGLLQSRVCGLVRMPFIPGLRLVDDPTAVELPAKAQDALEFVLDLAFGQPCH